MANISFGNHIEFMFDAFQDVEHEHAITVKFRIIRCGKSVGENALSHTTVKMKYRPDSSLFIWREADRGLYNVHTPNEEEEIYDFCSFRTYIPRWSSDASVCVCVCVTVSWWRWYALRVTIFLLSLSAYDGMLLAGWLACCHIFDCVIVNTCSLYKYC